LLAAALHDDDEERRLRAARELRERPQATAIPALLVALVDSNAGVRWLAGEALIHTGPAAVPPILEALINSEPSAWLFEEAEHVLRHLQVPAFHGALAPVIEACHHSTRNVEVPAKAALALQAISQSSP
jgi:HEAT repeat protein